MGFKSSRWIFSISDSSSICTGVHSRTHTGTDTSPAAVAALYRLSPAIIIYLPSGRGVTISGVIIPCFLMLSTSADNATSSNCLRGWSMFGTMFDNNISEVSAEPMTDSSSISLNNAPSPLPRPPFLIGDIIFSVKVFFLLYTAQAKKSSKTVKSVLVLNFFALQIFRHKLSNILAFKRILCRNRTD